MADLLVADTDLIIDFLRGRGAGAPLVREWLQARRLRLTSITAYELGSGLDFDDRQEEILGLLDGRTLHLDVASALAAGRVRRRLKAAGLEIGTPDLLQAGICLRHGLPFATRNRRRFDRVPGLTLVPLET